MASFTLRQLANKKSIAPKTLGKWLKEDGFKKQSRGRNYSETEAFAIAQKYDFTIKELNGHTHPQAAILAKVFPNGSK